MSKNAKQPNQEKSQPVWDVLTGVSAAVGQVTNITALLIPFLQDKELIGKIEDQGLFHRLCATLERDLRDMTAQYRTIYAQHEGRRGQSKNPTDVMRTIDIHQQYVDWAGSFDDVVIPTFMDMLTMIRDAGGNTDIVVVPSATAAIQAN